MSGEYTYLFHSNTAACEKKEISVPFNCHKSKQNGENEPVIDSMTQVGNRCCRFLLSINHRKSSLCTRGVWFPLCAEGVGFWCIRGRSCIALTRDEMMSYVFVHLNHCSKLCRILATRKLDFSKTS